STELFGQLLEASRGYVGFFAHRSRPRGGTAGGPRVYELEWQSVTERGALCRVLIADQSHSLDVSQIAADMPGLLEVQQFAPRFEEGQPVFRFQSADHLATVLPALLAGVRSDLGLAEAATPVQAPARSEVFVSYAHLDDRDDRPWLQML